MSDRYDGVFLVFSSLYNISFWAGFISHDIYFFSFVSISYPLAAAPSFRRSYFVCQALMLSLIYTIRFVW